MNETMKKIIAMDFLDCYNSRKELKKFRKYRNGEEHYEIPSSDGGTFIISRVGEYCMVEREKRHIRIARKTQYSSIRPEYNEKVVKFILANPHGFNDFFKEKSEESYEYGLFYYFDNLVNAVLK